MGMTREEASREDNENVFSWLRMILKAGKF